MKEGTLEHLGQMLAGGGKVVVVPSKGLMITKFAKGGQGMKRDVKVIDRAVYRVDMVCMRPYRECASGTLGPGHFYTAFYNERWHQVQDVNGWRVSPITNATFELALHGDDALEPEPVETVTVRWNNVEYTVDKKVGELISKLLAELHAARMPF